MALDASHWQSLAEALHEACGLSPEDEWSLSWVSREAIQSLNRDYRGVDAPTDVLAFSLEEGEEAWPSPMPGRMLGDVVVAVEVAAEQAARRGHGLDAELALLMVHGLLHLLGEDHDTPTRKTRMWQRQAELLTQIGFPEPISVDDPPAQKPASRRRKAAGA